MGSLVFVFLIIIIVMIVFLLCTKASIFSCWGNFFSTELSVTPTRLVGKKGSSNMERVDFPIEQVSSVSIKTNFWGQLFNYATIEVNASGKLIEFEGIGNAEEFQRYCVDVLKIKEDKQIKKQADAMSQAVASAMQSIQPQSTTTGSAGNDDKIKKLNDLNQLKQQGAISDEEFEKLKSEIL